jgi:hypothetical protein
MMARLEQTDFSVTLRKFQEMTWSTLELKIRKSLNSRMLQVENQVEN